MKPRSAPGHGARDSFPWYRSWVGEHTRFRTNRIKNIDTAEKFFVNSSSLVRVSVRQVLGPDSPSVDAARPTTPLHPSLVTGHESRFGGRRFRLKENPGTETSGQGSPACAPYICPSAPAHKLIVFSSSLPIAFK